MAQGFEEEYGTARKVLIENGLYPTRERVRLLVEWGLGLATREEIERSLAFRYRPVPLDKILNDDRLDF